MNRRITEIVPPKEEAANNWRRNASMYRYQYINWQESGSHW